MNILTLDVETTISNKGNPFDKTNKLVNICIKLEEREAIDYYYLDFPQDTVDHIQSIINRADLLVGFNIKFDLHWLRNIGISFDGKRIWDCQIGEFILSNQKNIYPSLEETAVKYSLGNKIDVVKLDYWNKGIDTDKIPRSILTPYVKQDVCLTENIYKIQRDIFLNDDRSKIFKLQCQDLIVLEEMEYNGILFNTKKARGKAEEIRVELDSIKSSISSLIGNIPINFNSNDHISAILYGGKIIEEIRVQIGVYKTGAKIGQPRNKVVIKEYPLPRRVTPLENTKTKEDENGHPTHWQVNEKVLRQLKVNKESKKLIDLLNLYAEKEKLSGTYLKGWSDLIEEMHWDKDVIHGNLNQCSVITGRLSSTKPNLQNADPTTKIYCESRYL